MINKPVEDFQSHRLHYYQHISCISYCIRLKLYIACLISVKESFVDLSGPDPGAKGYAASGKVVNIDDENGNKENSDALRTVS